MAATARPPVTISLSKVPGAVYDRAAIPLRVTFENVGAEAVRILRHFDPLPVFFAFSMVAEDGTSVAIPGMGKIDFLAGSIRYVELDPGETFSVDVDLAEVIASPERVTNSTYAIAATYHNQYGENCFRGIIHSNAIDVNLAGG